MSFKVVKARREGGRQFFRVANGLKLYGAWLRDGSEPLVQRIVVPFDESASNRYLNVKDPSVLEAVLGAVKSFVEVNNELT